MIINSSNTLIVWLLEKKGRIIAAGICAITLPLIGLSLYISTQITSEFNNIILEENKTFLNLTANHIEKKINSDISTAKIFADRPLLASAFKNGNRNTAQMHLENFIKNSLSIEKAFLFTPQGEGFTSFPDRHPFNGKSFSDKEWFQGISSTGEPYVSDFFLSDEEPKRYHFTISVPLKEKSGAMVGILVIQPKEDYLKDVLSGIHIGKSLLYLVDKKGNLVYHPSYTIDRMIDFSALPAVQTVKKGIKGFDESYDSFRNEQIVSAFQPMKWGWGIIIQRPEKEIMNPVRRILVGLFIFTSIFLVIGIYIAYNGTGLLFSIRNLSMLLHEQKKIERETNVKLNAELIIRKAAEQKLEQTLNALERSNRELEQFAYVASHDLQEPLRKIASFTELLEKKNRGKLGEDADRHIGYIVDGAKRMGQLINDLLTFSRIGKNDTRFEKTNFNELFTLATDTLQLKIDECGAKVTSDDLPLLPADGSQMSLLFQNLIGNGLKFRGSDQPRIHVSAHQDGDDWVFSVSDNGIGIEKEFFERIFVMFQRLHSKTDYPGTGIGLAICKKIIERHAGQIWVESEFGNGATFFFRIPSNRDNKGENR